MQEMRHGKVSVIGGAEPKLTLLKGVQLFRILKICTIILLAGCLQASATGFGQKITLNEKEVPLTKVFKEIKKQTGFRFFYLSQQMEEAKKVTIHVKDASLNEVLTLCFKDQPFGYEVKEGVIIVKLKSPTTTSISLTATPPGDIEVKGVITDEKGSPLIGANVKVKGSNVGTTTDNQGRFTLPNLDENAILEISFVGHDSQSFHIKGKAFFTIALNPKQSILDETIVIAYGQTTKRLNTGNVGTVKASDIEKQPVTNPLLALQGRVPGLYITQNTGVSGGGITVRIQGQNSLLNGNDPLYVIDGVPYFSQLRVLGQGTTILGNSGGQATNLGASTMAGNPLSLVNPLDIESIEVLKDADATAIYGSRAANGAILITTKKGKPGKMKVEINLEQGWGKVGHKMDLLNTEQYVQMRKEALLNDGLIPSANPAATEPFKYAPDLMQWDTTQYTDWQKVLIGGTSRYSNVGVNVSGGTSMLQYLVGGNYHRESTVFPGDFVDQKVAAHFNIRSTSTNQKFSIQVSSSFLADNNQLPQTDLTQSALLFEPNAPSLYNLNGTLNWEPNSNGNSTFYNPLATLFKTYTNKTNNLISNFVLSYQIFKGLDIKSSFGYVNIQSYEFSANPLIAVRPESRASTNRTAFYGNSTLNSWSFEPQIAFERNISKGKLEILVGSTILENRNSGQRVNGTGFTNDLVLKDINSAATLNKGGSFSTQYRYNAIFSRLNYNWENKYIVTLTARRDGSSRFGPSNQFHNFGSAGMAWIFSQEKLIKDHISFLSFGKLKASYGTTGNDQIGDYAFLNLYNPTSSIGVAYQGITASTPTSLSNPYLAWEETRKMSYGLDLGFLKDNILITLLYQINKSSSLLLPYTLPSITGFSSITTNFPATIQNTSWEFSFATTNFKSTNITWSTNFNLTIPQNKLVAFQNLANSNYASSLIIGKPITVQMAYRFMGVDPNSGLYLFSDEHGNPTSTPNELTDRTFLVNTSPKFYGGFQNSLRYKKFELDFLFQFVKQISATGNIQYMSQYPGLYFNGGGAANQSTTVLNRWQKPGDIAKIQKFSTILDASLVKSSSAYYDDASFIRLKNLSLSWQLPAQVERTIRSKYCRIYIQGQNLLTFTKYVGLDPENQNIAFLPPLRMITIGVRAGF